MEKVLSRVLRMLAALLLALGAGTAAHARVPVGTCVFPLEAGATSAGRLIAQATPVACASDPHALGGGNFGVRLDFVPQHSDPADPLVLRHSSLWQEAERIVLRYADGTSARIEWDSRSAARYMTIGAMLEFPVPPRAAPLVGAYVEIRGSANWRSVLQGVSLVRRSEAAREQAWLIALYAAFGGLALALVIYNLALWSALRHRFQLHYCAMVGALAAYTFSSSGALLLAVPALDNNDRMRINYVMLVLAGLAAFRFIVDFFGAEVLSARLRRWINLMGLTTLAISLAFAAYAPVLGHLLDNAYFLSGAIWLGLLIPVVAQAWQARVRHFWLFVLAWSAPVAASLVRAAHGLGLVPYSFWLDNGNMIALSVESLLSTLLIVTRLRDLSAERDKARAGERSAIRLANSDPLTGLLNRRAFLDLAIGRDQPHRLLLVDIDRFKAINDRVGHDIGDEVLCAVARLLQDLRPPESLAVRLGGEEFALLVPLARMQDCPPERILETVRQHAMPFGIRATVSLGFADGWVTTADDWKRLYRLADSALYRAKADGRNRACRATDFTTAPAAASA